MNDDKPYDQFVREQLAGDELDEVTPDSIIATGYYRLGVWQDEPVDPVQELYEDLDDITRTTGEVFLGLTVGCARCHNHKLDPIPQQDYYRLVAFFRNVRRYGVRSPQSVMDASVREIDTPAEKEGFESVIAEYKRKLQGVEQALKQLETSASRKFSDVDKEDFQYEMNRLAIIENYLSEKQFRKYTKLTDERNDLRKHPPSGRAKALSVKENGRQCPPTYLLVRGNAHVPGERVEPGFPSVLSPPQPNIVPPRNTVNSTGRRRALANWITSAANPLTARVIANRLWQYHFGRGIVRSSNNFGFQGAAPTHKDLLDWLSDELVKGGWRLKRMHKLMMLSSVYQMSSRVRDAALARDPENDLFWRYNMRRLTAEEIRDSLLVVNGSLNPKMFGPSVYPIISDEVKAGQSRPGSGWGDSAQEERNRRSIYIHIKRSLAVPMIAAFDGPDPDATCPVRFVTTQPTQSLGMLNGEFLNRQARVFADYLRKYAGENRRACVELALTRTLQRKPSSAEIARGVKLIESLRQKHHIDDRRALDYYCLVVLNLNEFIYLD